MNEVINLQKKLMPDLLDKMTERYRILQSVHFLQPIGRRGLAANLGMTERILRAEVTFLNQQGLIQIESSGMKLTSEGERVYSELEEIIQDVSELPKLEKQLKARFGLKQVIVMPGNSDEMPWVKNEMGLAGVNLMDSLLRPAGDIVAVTGGSTVAAVAHMMRPLKKPSEPLFLSARGGLGEQAENQANTICAEMAEKAEGRYQLLHVPDQLSEESYHSLSEEPAIKEVMALVGEATMIVHGIGDAMTMAERRRSSESVKRKIAGADGVAEAFGYYFDQSGQVIHKITTIGLQLEQLKCCENVIGVAGGKSKAKAIEAYYKNTPSGILITDEGAAEEILS